MYTSASFNIILPSTMASFTKESHYSNVTASSRELRIADVHARHCELRKILGIIRFSLTNLSQNSKQTCAIEL